MRLLSLLCCTLGLFALCALQLGAADAVFSKDGKSVYLAGDETPLERIDLDALTRTAAKVPAILAKEHFVAVSRSNTGYILCLSEKQLWAFDLEKNTATKVCAAPANTRFEDCAYDPQSGAILLSGRSSSKSATDATDKWTLFVLPKGRTKLMEVFVRRVSYMEGMVVDAEGNLFFGSRGDLWHGHVSFEKDDPGLPKAVLTAYRYAPLATLETALGTPSQTGVQAVAAGRKFLYAHVHRLGGSGWGDVVRLRKPSTPANLDEFETPDGLAERLKIYGEAIGSVEILGENGGAAWLCASADGQRVLFVTRGEDGPHWWLVTDDGAPQELKLPKEKN